MADCLLHHPRMLDSVSLQLEKYMDLVATRQKLVAANIANADTPGYRTKDIAFQMEFQTLVQGEKPRVVEVPDLKVKNDGNDVNLDREARLLSENSLRFNFAENMLRDRIKELRSAIQEGK
jgi:flagellar basal-body rod protein FlgB